MSRFTLPRDLYYGKDSLEVLKTLKGKKAILVLGGGSMKKFGFVDKVVAYLKEAGIETQLFENVEPDPSVETVMKGAEAMRAFEPDWIISMGGGSPIDAAKAMWDVYTKDRIKTGKTHRRGDKMKEGEYHLVIHVCIFNSKNELLVQQRQPFKKGWPNMWDVSVGGSAVAGDDSRQAAEREVLEELGLKLDLSGKRPSFTMNFSDGFDDYYIVKQDVDIEQLHLQKEEVKQVKWVNREEALHMQRAGIMVPYWFLDKLFDLGDVHEFDAHGNRNSALKICYASCDNLKSWMSLVEIVRENFPGLETEKGMEEYYQTLIKNVKEKKKKTDFRL